MMKLLLQNNRTGDIDSWDVLDAMLVDSETMAYLVNEESVYTGRKIFYD
jgi:hypothetical protein